MDSNLDRVGGPAEDSPRRSVPHYYESLGMGHDLLLRCKDCQRLVTHVELSKNGCCRCGNRRVAQIQTLTLWEWFKIRVGIIRFPYRKEFLAEFSSNG